MSELDELHYQLPPDVLHYEPRYYFGLTATDLVIVALPSILVIAVWAIVPGLITAVIGIALLKRFDDFGNRSAPVYFIQKWQYNSRQRKVAVPLILPPESEALSFESWEGETLFGIESEK